MSDVLKSLEIGDGSRIVLEDWKVSGYSDNVFRVDIAGAVIWQIIPPRGISDRDMFRNIYACDGDFFAYRESGGEYRLDLATGTAVLTRELK